MYLGWARLGKTEMVSASRQYAYAEAAGLDWLGYCLACYSLETLLPLGLDGAYSKAAAGKYIHPAKDPAPWYKTGNLDSEGFYGISLLEMTGIDDGTRTLQMNASITGGAAGGRTYLKHREMVAKLLLVAEEECSLQYGLEWLRNLHEGELGCLGVEFHYYSCCPCLCTEIHTLEPECLAECINPYLRVLKGVRMSGGPTVLERFNVSCGAAMTVEMSLVAGDPVVYSPHVTLLSVDLVDGTPYTDIASEPVVPVDPFRPDLVVPVYEIPREPIPVNWLRTLLPLSLESLEADRPMVPQIRLTAQEAVTSGIRVGLRTSGIDLGSWFVRRIPQGGVIDLTTNTGDVEVTYQGTTEFRGDVVIGGDGGPPSWLKPLDYGDLEVVVDRASSGKVQVDVSASTVWSSA